MRHLRFWKKVYNKGNNLVPLANFPSVCLRGNSPTSLKKKVLSRNYQ